MRRAVAGPEIERLIQLLARLPGLGPRSARRAALHLVKHREELMEPLAAAIADAHAKIEICSVCGNVDTRDPCTVCADATRDPSILVVVENVADLWALERAGVAKPVHASLLVGICSQYSAFRRSRASGDTVQARQSFEAYRKALNEVGLTPASAGRVKGTTGDDKDPTEKFFTGPKPVA